MNKSGWFIGGVLVGILLGIAMVIAASTMDVGKFQNFALDATIKGTGLTLAIFFARPVIMRMMKIAKVEFPELSDTESAVGVTIGYLERFLASSFVLDGSDNAISMLIAAKGVYRIHELGFGAASGNDKVVEASKENKTFYIMIGTFSSIAYAIAIGFAANYLLELAKMTVR